MVQMYTILGRQIGSHYVRQIPYSPMIQNLHLFIRGPLTNTIPSVQLALATLLTTGGGIGLAMSGKEKKKEQGPAINASSKEEEEFIQYAITIAEVDDWGVQ